MSEDDLSEHSSQTRVPAEFFDELLAALDVPASQNDALRRAEAAARRSTDTETQWDDLDRFHARKMRDPEYRAAHEAIQMRDVLRDHYPVMRSETGPFSGCRCGQVKLGQDVIAHVTAQLVAALE